jgi:hypothetical protein
VAAALALGGCAESATNVAVVNGKAITHSQFDRDLEGARQVSQLSDDQVLSVLIQGEVAAQVAERRGLQISDADRDKQLNPAVLQVPAAHDLAYDLADVQIVSSKIGEDQFKKALVSADVKVNPRYGSWDPRQSLAVVPGTGSLSQTAEQRPQ